MLDLSDGFGSSGTAVVAQIHPKGDQSLLIDMGDDILDQWIIGAFFVAQHLLGGFQKFSLKASISKA